MAKAANDDPIEMSQSVADEEEWIAKCKENFGKDMDLCHDYDVRRIIRGYAKEKEREKETFEKMQIWIDAIKANWSGCGFKPMEDQDAFKKMLEWAPITAHGQDKYGHPVVYEDLAHYKCEKISAELDKALIYRKRVWSQVWNKKHQESKKKGKMIYKHIQVFNLKDVGVMSANKFKSVIQQMIKVEGDLQPETIYKMYMVNTNWFFKAAWAVVKSFVHPATREKIQIVGSDYVKHLTVDVAIEQIPKEFNGKGSSCKWGETTFDEAVVEQFPDLLKGLDQKAVEVKTDAAKIEESKEVTA